MTQSDGIDPATARLLGIENEIRAGRIDEAIIALKAFNAAYPADVRVLFFDALIARSRQDTRGELLAFKRVPEATLVACSDQIARNPDADIVRRGITVGHDHLLQKQ